MFYKTSIQLTYDQFYDTWHNQHLTRFGSSFRLDYDSARREYSVFCKVVDAILERRETGPFCKKNLWMIEYIVLGELQKEAYYNGSRFTATVSFDRKAGTYDTFDQKFFTFMLTIYHHVTDIGGRGFGFPRYLKVGDEREFLSNLYRISSNPRCVASIMDVPNSKKVVYTEQDAADAARFRSTAHCIEYCKKNSSGGWLRYFKDEASFKRAAVRFHEECVEYYAVHVRYGSVTLDQAKEASKKMRLTLGTCERYLRYLAYMSCISVRVDRPVSMSSKLQSDVFGNGYAVLREVSISLGWMVCTDETYSPKLRCMTFQPRVCVDKTLKADMTPSLNKAEARIVEYMSRFPMKDMVAQYGHDLIQSVVDRKNYVYVSSELKDMPAAFRSMFGKYKWEYGECGDDIISMQWLKSSDRRQWNANNTRLLKLVEEYRLKYSRPRQGWLTGVQLKVA